MQLTLCFAALAISALLLGAGGHGIAITEAVERPPPLLVPGRGMAESVRGSDAGVAEGDFAQADGTEAGIPRAAVTPGDLEILARIVKGECPPDTPFEGKVAVAAVVLNRVRSKRFPMTVAAVAHQEKQFSCCNPSSRARLYDGPIPPAAWEAARVAVDGQDPTGGCTHFFNPYLVQPGWARELEFVKRIGTAPGNTHAFYRDREGR